MTLVTALKMGTRIVILSDTKISNRDHLRPNSIPGRLKAVVLSHTLSIAYAGLSSQALDAIREIYKRAPSSLSIALEVLLSTSRKFEEEIDFIICSHDDPSSPRLLKIQSGRVFEGSDFYWIGSAYSANAVSKIEVDLGTGHNITDLEQIREAKYIQAFMRHLSSTDDQDVGGLVINCLCSPHGHCYQSHASATVNDEFHFPPLHDEAARLRDHKAGQRSFSYHVYSAPDRGPAIVGCYFEQPEVGYFYTPLHHDDPMLVRATDQAEFHRLLSLQAPSLLHAQHGV